MKQPKIRFKWFSGEWEKSTIGNISTSFSGGTPSVGVANYYGGSIPFIRSGEIAEDKTQLFLTEEGLNSSSARMVEKGTLLYALYGATSGEVGVSKIDGAINQAILAIIPKKGYSTTYLSHYLRGKKDIIVGALLQGGQGNLSGALVKEVEVNLPRTFEEQCAIANYLDHLDTLIQSTTKKIDSLKQVKAASLQSMFPQEGETTPRVRFKGFEGEWEIVPFAKVFSFVKNNSFTRDQLSVSEGEVKNVHYGDVLIKFGDIIDGKKDCLPYIIGLKQSNKLCQTALLRDGDIIIADAAEDNTVGKCSEMFNINNEYVLSGLHTIACRPLIIFALGYLGHYMNTDSYHNQLLPLIQGSKISSISKSAVLQTSILFPSYAEQQQIASYFTALDSQISLHSQRLEKLKQIKSACLDNMFV